MIVSEDLMSEFKFRGSPHSLGLGVQVSLPSTIGLFLDVELGRV